MGESSRLSLKKKKGVRFFYILLCLRARRCQRRFKRRQRRIRLRRWIVIEFSE
jgi:hypothetical protein